jgi:acetyl esterase
MELEGPVRDWLALIDRHRARHPVVPDADMATLRAAEAALADALFDAVTFPGPAVDEIRDLVVPVAGGTIRVRLYRPAAGAALPIHVDLHGGGFVSGSIDDRVVDALCRERAVGAGCAVASVDYRLAPEHRFPTGLEDSYAAATWLAAHAHELALDGARMSIGGASAGANLAAGVAILARDRGGPALRLQLLEVPALDLTLSQPSAVELSDGAGLEQWRLDALLAAYLDDPARRTDPLVSPLLAGDLSGLPPAHILTAERDPLRDGGEAYARRLAQAGVPVVCRRHAGHVHGSPGLTRTFPAARRWQADVVDALRRAHITDEEESACRSSP